MQETVENVIEVISYIGVTVSLVGLTLTVISLSCFKYVKSIAVHESRYFDHTRKIRSKDTSRFHIQLCCALIGMLLVFVTGIDKTGNFGGCVTVSVLIHYFTLVAVMWMGAEAFLMFQKFVIVFVQINIRYIIILSLICWGK